MFSKIIISAMVLLGIPSVVIASENWDYDQKGPAKWGELDPQYYQCDKGKEQSPINIKSSEVNEGNQMVHFHYEETTFQVEEKNYTLKALPQNKNYITVDKKTYILKQLHFHHPSEHLLNGEQFPMELHLVHENEDGNLAVVGMFINEGASNEVLASYFKEEPEEIKADMARLIPSDPTIYRYKGSLTTPPCTEGVKWLVINESISLSENLIKEFTERFPKNNRPVQPIGDRLIKKIE